MAVQVIDASRVGQDWHEQQLRGINLIGLVRLIREAVQSGHFDTRDWDHNSVRYVAGRSNKRIKIGAAIALGREPRDMEEAWQVMLELAA